MSSFRIAAVVIIAIVMTLPSCAWYDSMAKASAEQPAEAHDSYLQGGPSTDIELGQDERTLLEDYKVLNDAKIDLETRLGETRAANEQLETQLGRAEQERDRFRNQFAGATQEIERGDRRARELEAKVLSLTIESTMLEQELLRHRIASLKQQYENTVANMSTPAEPPGGRR